MFMSIHYTVRVINRIKLMPLQTLEEKLISGYKRFRTGRYIDEKALFKDLSDNGQHPKVMIISCCDSRAEPAEIFDTQPGDIFVLRNVANMVPEKQDGHVHDSAYCAIDYAVNVIGVKVILVMGHESCGGIAAAISGMGNNPQSSLQSWIAQLNATRDIVLRDYSAEEQQSALEHESIRQSISNIAEIDYVKAKIDNAELALIGAHFSIHDGSLAIMDESGQFADVALA